MEGSCGARGWHGAPRNSTGGARHPATRAGIPIALGRQAGCQAEKQRWAAASRVKRKRDRGIDGQLQTMPRWQVRRVSVISTSWPKDAVSDCNFMAKGCVLSACSSQAPASHASNPQVPHLWPAAWRVFAATAEPGSPAPSLQKDPERKAMKVAVPFNVRSRMTETNTSRSCMPGQHCVVFHSSFA